MKKKLMILASLSVLGLSACGSKPISSIVTQSFEEANSVGTIRLEVDVSKLRSSKGQICYALFDDAKGFPSTQESVVKSGCQALVAGSEPGRSLLVIEDIAASSDSFALSFDEVVSHSSPLEIEKWQEEVVIGLRGPIEDENLDLLVEALRLTMEDWRPAPLQAPVLAADL